MDKCGGRRCPGGAWARVIVLGFFAPLFITACEKAPYQFSETIDVAEQSVNAGFVERAIPLRFVRLFQYSDPSDEPIILLEWLNDNVRFANQTFRAAGVQFYISSIDDCSVGESAFGVQQDQTEVSWASPAVRMGLQCAFPGMGDPGLGLKPPNYYLNWSAVEHQHPSEIVIWLHHSGLVPHGVLPWAGTGLHINGGEALNVNRRRWLLAHELGHMLGGFSHAHDWGDVVASPFPVNPRTGSSFQKCDAWDLVYKRNLFGTTFFDSRIAACSYEASLNEIYTKTPANWWSSDSCGVLSGRVTDLGGVPYFLAVPDPALKGLGLSVGTQCSANSYSHAQNVMIMEEQIPNAEGAYAMLSDSQIDRLRSYLRYETEITENNCGQAGKPHGRTRLGRFEYREPSYLLDFDGDGKRDVAWWDPPINNGQRGTFRVLLSSYGFSRLPLESMTIQLGRLGNVPVLGDYDGDGRTDLALFVPGGGLYGQDPALTQGLWVYCLTAANPLATSCSLVPVMSFGQRGDIPLAGVDFDGDGRNELAVYRPSPGEFRWAQVNAPGVQSVRSLGGPGQVPLPGLYDGDNKTDLAVYDPSTATFRIRKSSSCFMNNCWFMVNLLELDPTGVHNLVASPGPTAVQRAGAFPIRGMQRSFFQGLIPIGGIMLPKYDPRLVFAVYAPGDNTWHVAWDPFNSTITRCVWGASGAVPLGGIGSSWDWTLQHHYSKMAYYTSTNSTGPGSITIKDSLWNDCSGATAQVQSVDWKPRTMVYPVRDMFGDKLPEIIALEPDTGVAKVLDSSNGYTTHMIIEMGTQLSIIL